MVHFASIWNDVKCGADLSLSIFRSPDVISKRLIRVLYSILYFENGMP